MADKVQIKLKGSKGGVATVERSAFEALWKHKGFEIAGAESGPKIHEVGPAVEKSAAKAAAPGSQKEGS